MTMVRSRIIGCGSYLPSRIVSNKDLTAFVDTSDEWIRQRTGIRQRHFAADGETCADLALAAARRALASADVTVDEIDFLILATTTPNNTFPATATLVQAQLGMTGGAAFDVQSVCSGFVYALTVADGFIRCGQARTVVVIGAETYSRILDWEDRATCVLFGDGAGAVVLRADSGAGTTEDRGILSTHLRTDGRLYDLLYVDGGVSTTQTAGHVRMLGREVFKHAVNRLAEVADQVLDRAGVGREAVDWLVPHQANRRIIDATARKLDLPPDKVVLTVDRHANTSAASIPLALDEAVRDGRIGGRDLVLMEAMGGGLSWGGALVRM